MAHSFCVPRIPGNGCFATRPGDRTTGRARRNACRKAPSLHPTGLRQGTTQGGRRHTRVSRTFAAQSSSCWRLSAHRHEAASHILLKYSSLPSKTTSETGPYHLLGTDETSELLVAECQGNVPAAQEHSQPATATPQPWWSSRWRVRALLALLAVLVSGVGLLTTPESAIASGPGIASGASMASRTAGMASGTGGSTQTLAKSSVGIKVASWLRSAAGGGLPDEAIVVLVAALPVVELRGALPVAYWMGMPPLKATLLAVFGNMIPVPFILLFLEPLSKALTSWNSQAKDTLDWVLEYTRRKAGPIEEFQALGLMLFVAVPLPGTGAWSGAIASYVLKLPFWEALLANFFGVVLAGAIVSALCLLGLKEAVALAVGLFVLSGVMWSGLRVVFPKK